MDLHNLKLDEQRCHEPRPSPDIAQLFASAVEHHQIGRLRDAERMYRLVLAYNPHHINAQYNLGLLALQVGRPDSAVMLIGKAVAIRGRVPEWHYNLAFALCAVGRTDDAIAHYRNAIRLKPDYVEAYMNLGNMLKDCGKREEAAACYERVTGLNPNATEALFNLANVLADQSEWERAAEIYGRAIKLRPDFSEAHNNLAIVLGVRGRTAEAIEHYRRALELNPNLVEARVNMGKILTENGQLDEGIVQYQLALASRPDFVQAIHNMSVALMAKGDVDQAIVTCQRALALNPSLAEAHDNLGVMMLTLGHAREARSWFERALKVKPDFVEAYNHLARAWLAERNASQALDVLSRALTIREIPATKALFVDCLKNVLTISDSARFRPLVLRALSEPWGRQSDIARFSARLVMQSSKIGAAVTRAVAAWPARLSLDTLLQPSELKALTGDPLLLSLLECGHVPDIALERFLTSLRSAFLDVVMNSDEQRQFTGDELRLYCALARLCFLNDYVFACTDDEVRKAERLRDRLVMAMHASSPIPALWLIAVSTYFPLNKLPAGASLVLRSWPPPVASLLDLQVRKAEEEQKLKSSLPRLTPIKDEVSIRVREQYEDHPYPRWAKPAPAPCHTTFDDYLRRVLPCTAFAPLGMRENVDVLIAGCGTGQHPIEVALRLKGARILAVDLSLASLAYAKRETLALGLENIEYAQADIGELASLGRTFDVIESAGVLHHLPDPQAGSQVLLSLLRPNGFLFLALYSDIARRDIVTARDFIAAHGYRPTTEDIRHCRQDLMDAPEGTPLSNVTYSVDFYSTSECRDLLFHAQENRTTLPEIKAYLAKNKLRFLGFEIDPWTRYQYAATFRDDPAMTDLDRWRAFERQHPLTFARMYQFWAQKAA
ncbi:MAG: tetratricopeptide repeat protein [Bradyrhizobiaceae bacterium]|nr:tetratricopeptide repeat protein [Bradyrhizobiaceae bacterium]